MEEFFKSLPKVIAESSKSTLGIISLCIVSITFIAYIFFRNSNTRVKKNIFLTLIISIACFITLIIVKYPETKNKSLKRVTNEFIATSDQAIKEKTVIPNKSLPSSLIISRNNFESAWLSVSLIEKEKIPDSILYTALFNNIKIYRIQETYEPEKANSNKWADIAIEYFKNSKNNKYFSDILLEKSGIILEMSELNRSNKTLFRSLVSEGNNIIAKAYSLQNENSKSRVLRIWSRFYYDLSKPEDNIYSDTWDNIYLRQAYLKSIEAYNLDTQSLKSSTQLCRSLQRLANNPPQDIETKWTPIMRQAFKNHLNLWNSSNKKLADYADRIPPLNILAILGIETILREWIQSDKKIKIATLLVNEIDSIIIPAQEETITLVESSEYKKNYSADVYIDLAKIHIIKYQVQKTYDQTLANNSFNKAISYLKKARSFINDIQQLDALKKLLNTSKLYTSLDLSKKKIIKNIF